MKYRNILVPYDRSESAKRALSTALDLASEVPDAHVTALFVAPVPEFESSQFMIAERISGSMRATKEEIESMRDEYLNYERGLLLEDIGTAAEAAGDTLSIVVGAGRPSKAILKHAAENGCDLIVMGCRGMNAVAGMLGSVSYAVLRNAECPVLVEK